jgi:hypothetical protein
MANTAHIAAALCMSKEEEILRAALISQGVDPDEVLAKAGKPVTRRPKGVSKVQWAVSQGYSPEEIAQIKQQEVDDARREEYKARLVPGYHKKQNGAGRRDPGSLSNVVRLIQEDENVRGLSRFAAG